MVGLAAEDELPDALRERIVTVAEGNALFLEQLHAYLTEDVGATDVDIVPPTVEALLASRLDTLEAGERAVIERAAVIGRDFARNAVLHLSPPEELAGIDSRLAALERRGLVRALRGRPGEEETLRFHHVLIRDVAYAAITKERRADLHERHGSWLEKRSEPDELVGYHAEQAHRYRRELHPSDPDARSARVLGGRATRLGRHRGLEEGGHVGDRQPARSRVPAACRRTAPIASSSSASSVCAERASGDFERSEAILAEAVETASSARNRRLELRAQIELAAPPSLQRLRKVHRPSSSSWPRKRSRSSRSWATTVRLDAPGVTSATRARSKDGSPTGTRPWNGPSSTTAAPAGLHRDASPTWLPRFSTAPLRCPKHSTAATSSWRKRRTVQVARTCSRSWAGSRRSMGGSTSLGSTSQRQRRPTRRSETFTLVRTTAAACSGESRCSAGDPAAAERVLAECCETFERMHDAAGLSTVAAELADALYEQGRYDGAESWLELAEKRAASDDISAQWAWRRTRAKLLARGGAFGEAEATADEAVRLAARTDALERARRLSARPSGGAPARRSPRGSRRPRR